MLDLQATPTVNWMNVPLKRDIKLVATVACAAAAAAGQ